MAVKKILKMGNPILREISQTLSPEEILSESTTQLLCDMYDTMKFAGGIGIAAPQIGVLKSVALIQIDSDNPRYSKENLKEFPLLKIFNPIIEIIDPTLQGFYEGCLSVPGLRGFVQRPRAIKVTYLDEFANEQHIQAEGFLATVFQHELDHLFGKIYVDRIEDLKTLSFTDEIITE